MKKMDQSAVGSSQTCHKLDLSEFVDLPMTWYTNAEQKANKIGNKTGGYQSHHIIKGIRQYFMFQLVHHR